MTFYQFCDRDMKHLYNLFNMREGIYDKFCHCERSVLYYVAYLESDMWRVRMPVNALPLAKSFVSLD